MRTQTFTEIAAKYAATLGRSAGVNVVFQGREGRTDGKTIYIPALPAGAVLTPHEEKVFGGYLDHETGHVRWTDFTSLKKLARGEPQRKNMWNFIEDVRQELRHIDEYPGSKPYLDELAFEVDTQAKQTWAGKERTYAQLIVALLYKEFWAKYRECNTNTVDGWLGDHEELRPLEEMIATTFPLLKNANDSLDLADKILDFMKQLVPPDPPSEEPESEQGKGDKKEKGEKGQSGGKGDKKEKSEKQQKVKGDKKEKEEGDNESDDESGQEGAGEEEDEGKSGAESGSGGGSEGRGEDDGEADGEGDSEGDGSDDGSDDDDGEAADSGSAKSRSTGSDGPSKPGPSGDGATQSPIDHKKQEELLEEIVKSIETLAEMTDRTQTFNELMRAIKKGNEKLEAPDKGNRGHDMTGLDSGTMVLPPVNTKYDRVLIPWGEENKRQFASDRAMLAPQIMATKKMLNIYLQTLKQRTWTRGLEEGRLDPAALHTLMMGNRRVCKQLRGRQTMDTAVLLMLDLSSSMDDTIVRQAAILLSEACNGIQGLKLEICGFTTNTRREDAGDWRRAAVQTGCGRIDGVDIPIFKAFDEPYNKAQARIGAIRTTMATPLADGYAYGFEALVTRKEKRRVLWLVTDGEPYYNIEDARHSDWMHSKRIQAKCKKFKIETVALGIGYGRKVKQVVESFAEISDVDEMPKAVLEILKGILN